MTFCVCVGGREPEQGSFLVLQACRLCLQGALTFVTHEGNVCNEAVTKISYIGEKKCILQSVFFFFFLFRFRFFARL